MHLSSVVIINLVSKRCRPPIRDAKIKASGIATFSVNSLSIRFLLSGNSLVKGVRILSVFWSLFSHI